MTGPCDLSERGQAGPMLVIAAGLIGAAERTVPSALCWCAWCSGPGALAKVLEHAQAQVPVRPAERRHIVELLQHHDVHDAGYFAPGHGRAVPALDEGPHIPLSPSEIHGEGGQQTRIIASIVRRSGQPCLSGAWLHPDQPDLRAMTNDHRGTASRPERRLFVR